MNRIATAFAACFALVACNVPTDLNNPCRLSKPDPNNDGGLIFIMTTDPIVVGTNGTSTFSQFDFISSGDSDCENLVCIREANPAMGFYDDTDGYEHGRCSNNCIVDQGNSHSSNCGEAEKGLICRQLALDQSFIDAYCNSDPAGCQCIFGTDTSATYCVDPNAQATTSG
jgi:hypothetical protein